MFRRPWLRAAAVTLALAAPAAAQQTGTVVGTVRDAQGAALPGSAVRLQPASDVAGPDLAVQAGAAGVYEFPDVPPGTYGLRFEHPGFAVLLREGIVVRVAAVTRVDVTLELTSVTETITVVGTPVVDVATTVAQTTVGGEMAAALPTSRNPWVVAGLVPGVVTGRIDVGGTESTQQYAIEAFGSADSQKTFAVDGLKTNLPASTGGLTFQYFDFNAYEAYNFQVAAATAESDVGGVYINMVTRSGTNRFSGTQSFFYTGDKLQGSNLDDRLRDRLGIGPGQRAAAAGDPIRVAYDLGATAGGPIRRNRAWFFGSMRWWRHDQWQTGASNPDGSAAIDDNRLRNFISKATTAPTASVRASASYTLSLKDRFHRRDPPFLIAEDRATARQEGVSHNVMTEVDRALAQVFFEARAGRMWGELPSRYQRDVRPTDIALRDVVRLTRVNASDTVFTIPAHRNQFDAAVTLLRQGGWGAHDIKAGGRLMQERAGVHFDRNGDMILELREGVPFQAQLSNTPIRSENRISSWAAFVQDRWIVERLSVNAGVRLDGVEGWLPEQTSPAGTFIGERRFDTRRGLPRWPLSTAPRVGVAIDPTGRGVTAIKAYAGRFYNQIGTDVVTAVNGNAIAIANVSWTDINGNQVAEPEELGPFTGFAGGVTTRLDRAARRPYNDEFTIGIDHTLPFAVAVSAGYHRRHHRDGLGILDLARPADAYTPVERTYRDPATGAPIAVTLFDLDPVLRATRDRLLTTVPALRSVYDGVHVQATRWLSGRWQAMGGITVQRHRGFLHDGTFTSADFNNPNVTLHRDGAAIFTEVPWLAKASVTWLLPSDWRLAVSYTGRGGEALPRLGVFGGLTQASETVHLAPRGIDRTEAVTRLLDARFGKRLRAGPASMELSIDVFNMLNGNHVVLQNSVVGSAFGRPQLILAPRIVRLGASFDW